MIKARPEKKATEDRTVILSSVSSKMKWFDLKSLSFAKLGRSPEPLRSHRSL